MLHLLSPLVLALTIYERLGAAGTRVKDVLSVYTGSCKNGGRWLQGNRKGRPAMCAVGRVVEQDCPSVNNRNHGPSFQVLCLHRRPRFVVFSTLPCSMVIKYLLALTNLGSQLPNLGMPVSIHFHAFVSSSNSLSL